jgi:hypothetical protein
LGAQLTAELDAAFSREHPVENQKGEHLGREDRFGLFRAADGANFVSTTLDEPLQIFATPRVIFYKQNFHLRRSTIARRWVFSSPRERADPPWRTVYSGLWSRMIANNWICVEIARQTAVFYWIEARRTQDAPTCVASRLC